MQGFLTVFVLVVLAFVGFVIYFIFKQIQFFIQAINLYKKMVERQDMMIKLLSDIKDKTYTTRQIEIKNEPKISTEKKQVKVTTATVDKQSSIPDDETENKAPLSSFTKSEKKQVKVTTATVDKQPPIPDDEVVSVCPHCNEKYRDNLTNTDCPSCGGYIYITNNKI